MLSKYSTYYVTKRIFFFFLTAISLLSGFTVKANHTTKHMYWKIGNTTRDALVYIPEEAKSKSTPIIFIFHGHGGNMQNMLVSRGFQKLWPEAIVICPQGLNTPGQLTDPQGKLTGWQKAPGEMSDRDLYFFDEMLKTLKQGYKVDDKRIYVTGHSNGGGFTYLLWAVRSDVFAAFAPSAAVGFKVTNQLKPKPAIHIMGEKDTLVKAQWQRAMCSQILKINDCIPIGQPYASSATLYPSTNGMCVVLYIHPHGHIYPTEANSVVIKFFKSVAKS